MYPNDSPRNGLNDSLGASRGASPNQLSSSQNNFRPSVPGLPPNYYQPSELRKNDREPKDEIETLQDRIEMLEKINTELHNDNYQLRKKANNELPQSVIDNYQNRIVQLTNENQLIKNLNGRIDQSKVDNQNKTVLLSTEIERLQGELNRQSKDLLEANDKCQRLNRDLTTLYDQNDRLKRQILENSRNFVPPKDNTNLENKVALLTTEIERLTNQNKFKTDENKQLISDLAQKDAQINENQYRLERIPHLQEEIEKLKQNFRAKNDECEILKNQIARLERANQDDWKNKFLNAESRLSDLEKRNYTLSSENDRLRDNERALQEEKNNWFTRYSNMEASSKSVPRLQEEIAQLRKTVKRLEDEKEKYQHDNEDIQSKDERIKELQSKVLLLTNEIERLHFTIRGMYDEIEMQKSISNNLKTTLDEFTNLNQVNQELANNYNIARKQADDAKQKYNELSRQFDHFKNVLKQFEDEHDILLREKDDTIADLDRRLREFEVQNRNLLNEIDRLNQLIQDQHSYEQMINELNTRLKGAQHQLAQMDEKLHEEKARYDDLLDTHNKCELLRNENSILKEEKKSLENVIANQRATIDELKNKIRDLNQELAPLKDTLERLKLSEKDNQNLRDEISNLNQLIRDLENEIDNLKARLLSNEKELSDLRPRVERIPALLAEIERLQQERDELAFKLDQGENNKQLAELAKKNQELLGLLVLQTAMTEALNNRLDPKPEQEKPKDPRQTTNYHTVNPDSLKPSGYNRKY